MTAHPSDIRRHGLALDVGAADDAIVTRSRLDLMEVAHVRPGSWRYADTIRSLGESSPFLVFFGLSGTSMVAGEPLGHDQLVVTSAPDVAVEIEPGNELIVLRIPVEAVRPYRTALSLVEGMHLEAHEGTAGIVAHVLRGLATAFNPATARSSVGLAEHVIGLVALMCVDAGTPLASARQATLDEAKRYVEAHIGELALAPAQIARSLHISGRTLHRLFEIEGVTVGGWIRARRLDHCRADLADPRRDDEPVSTIGTRWGLPDPAHFSRLFKTVYGVSPREYRRNATHERAAETQRVA
jgi:AraC-like DNA-binding protein